MREKMVHLKILKRSGMAELLRQIIVKAIFQNQCYQILVGIGILRRNSASNNDENARKYHFLREDENLPDNQHKRFQSMTHVLEASFCGADIPGFWLKKGKFLFPAVRDWTIHSSTAFATKKSEPKRMTTLNSYFSLEILPQLYYATLDFFISLNSFFVHSPVELMVWKKICEAEV